VNLRIFGFISIAPCRLYLSGAETHPHENICKTRASPSLLKTYRKQLGEKKLRG
jgi:hypothetical protein